MPVDLTKEYPVQLPGILSKLEDSLSPESNMVFLVHYQPLLRSVYFAEGHFREPPSENPSELLFTYKTDHTVIEKAHLLLAPKVPIPSQAELDVWFAGLDIEVLKTPTIEVDDELSLDFDEDALDFFNEQKSETRIYHPKANFVEIIRTQSQIITSRWVDNDPSYGKRAGVWHTGSRARRFNYHLRETQLVGFPNPEFLEIYADYLQASQEKIIYPESMFLPNLAFLDAYAEKALLEEPQLLRQELANEIEKRKEIRQRMRRPYP